MISPQDTFANLEVRVLKRICVDTAKHELPTLVESAYMRGYKAGMANVLRHVPSMESAMEAHRSTTPRVSPGSLPPF